MATLNRQWHEQHRMPPRPSAEQRIAWHLAHAGQCGCRPIPAGVLALMRARGIASPPRTE
jgi:hypothetical protein